LLPLHGEEKMLFFRLNELDDYVDYFIISESEYTFKGDKNELLLILMTKNTQNLEINTQQKLEYLNFCII
jgi:hypothetical protein